MPGIPNRSNSGSRKGCALVPPTKIKDGGHCKGCHQKNVLGILLIDHMLFFTATLATFPDICHHCGREEPIHQGADTDQ